MASRPTSETCSSSSTSSAESAGDVRAHSAVHVLKGAVAKVMGPLRVSEAGVASVVIQSDGSPTPQQVAEVMKAANLKIAEDAEFVEFEMEREEAQGHFGDGIFDLSDGRAEGIILKMVRIPDWEASCCSRRHVQSAGEIGAIRQRSARFDDEKKQLELQFSLLR